MVMDIHTGTAWLYHNDFCVWCDGIGSHARNHNFAVWLMQRYPTCTTAEARNMMRDVRAELQRRGQVPEAWGVMADFIGRPDLHRCEML